MKTQKIIYKLPKTRFIPFKIRYFSLEFPEMQTLSAGMSWTIPITFRPVAKESYSDVIEFSTSFGKFHLPVKASLPEHIIEFSENIDFGLCPVCETAKKVFVMKNTGKLNSYYEWEIREPFNIYPKCGQLPPGANINITIEFKPKSACVLTAVAVCTFGTREQWEKSKVVQSATVYAIGKYAHISIEEDNKLFNFGDVFVGKTLEKKLVIQNYSSVEANFKIRKTEKDTDPYFEFSSTSGTVPAKKSIELLINFTPTAAGLLSNAYFDITTLSGNTIRIQCQGRGAIPQITLSPNILNFNDVPAGTTVNRAIYVVNHTSTSSFYQFVLDPLSTFKIDKPSGIINANSTIPLNIKFSPMDAINYYRTIYCLVEHQDVLALEVLGTCYNDKRRPATFKHHHVLSYRERVLNGLMEYGPEQLEEMINEGHVKYEKGALHYVNQKDVISKGFFGFKISGYLQA